MEILNMNIRYISGDIRIGGKVTVEIDGKVYSRIMRDRRDCGLYIVINNMMYFEYEFEY